jgi:hypothetical protein
MKGSLTLALFACLLLSGCNGGPPAPPVVIITSPIGFTITRPEGWITKESKSADISLSTEEGQIPSGAINVLAEEYEPRGKLTGERRLFNELSRTTTIATSQYPGSRYRGQGKTSLDGTPAAFANFSIKDENGDKFWFYIVVALRDGKKYQLICVGSGDDQDNFMPTFEAAVESWKWTKPG